jgi:hypothetical protein
MQSSTIRAEVAQLVEQSIRNRQVSGSSPDFGSRILAIFAFREHSHSWLRDFLDLQYFPDQIMIAKGAQRRSAVLLGSRLTLLDSGAPP